MIKLFLIWLVSILPPLVLEVFISFLICGLHLWVIYKFVTEVAILSIPEVSTCMYFFCAWIYSIYCFFHRGSAIAHSLIEWHKVFLYFIKKHFWKFILIASVLIVLLLFSQKPNIDTSQTDIFQARLTTINLNLESVSRWSISSKTKINLALENYNKVTNDLSKSTIKFSSPPDLKSLSFNPQEIDKLSSEFNDLIKYLNSDDNDISYTQYLFVEKERILNENAKQIFDIKEQTKILCKDEKMIGKCTSILELAEKLDHKIEPEKIALKEVENLFQKFTSSDTRIRNTFPSKLLWLWSGELEKHKNFDSKEADKWLKETFDLVDIGENKNIEFQNQNDAINVEASEALKTFNLSEDQYIQISDSIKSQEHKLDSADLNSLLSTANSNKNILLEKIKYIDDMEGAINKFVTNLTSISNDIKSRNEILRGLNGRGHSLINQADNNIDKTYSKLIEQRRLAAGHISLESSQAGA